MQKRALKAVSSAEFVDLRKELVIEWMFVISCDNDCSVSSSSVFIRMNAICSLAVSRKEQSNLSVALRERSLCILVFLSSSVFLFSKRADALDVTLSKRSLACSPTLWILS